MGQSKKEPLSTEDLAKNLATYAIDREDLKMLMEALYDNSEINPTTMEYELQILKILSVGWAISYFMPDNGNKAEVSHFFWDSIRETSENISKLTLTTTGQDIDYFSVLKQRLDFYVSLMQDSTPEVSEPVQVMGPAFAKLCKCPENALAILTGTKMFTLCLGGVKEYINAVGYHL